MEVPPPNHVDHAGLTTRVGRHINSCAFVDMADGIQTHGAPSCPPSAVLPHAPDAWHGPCGLVVGIETGFACYSYGPQLLRTLEKIRQDIPAFRAEIFGESGKVS